MMGSTAQGCLMLEWLRELLSKLVNWIIDLLVRLGIVLGIASICAMILWVFLKELFKPLTDIVFK